MLHLNLTATFAVKIYHTNTWVKVPFVKEKTSCYQVFQAGKPLYYGITPAVKTTLKGKKRNWKNIIRVAQTEVFIIHLLAWHQFQSKENLRRFSPQALKKHF